MIHTRSSIQELQNLLFTCAQKRRRVSTGKPYQPLFTESWAGRGETIGAGRCEIGSPNTSKAAPLDFIVEIYPALLLMMGVIDLGR